MILHRGDAFGLRFLASAPACGVGRSTRRAGGKTDGGELRHGRERQSSTATRPKSPPRAPADVYARVVGRAMLNRHLRSHAICGRRCPSALVFLHRPGADRCAIRKLSLNGDLASRSVTRAGRGLPHIGLPRSAAHENGDRFGRAKRVDMKTAQIGLGHADPALTAQRYAIATKTEGWTNGGGRSSTTIRPR